MFWKLLLTIAVILLLFGRTSVLHHPILRLVLPRSWVTALSLLPTSAPRRGPPSRREGPAPAEADPEPAVDARSRRWLDGKIRLILFALLLLGIAAWMATRVVIMADTDAGASLPAP
ncbi:hypothetical protein AB1L88_04250 [Tautonia sp. JC769]|uniref:hypothetical protein n=1 Tax=Tautonia sp. JC769 TaxID=3232135 RepID=UPI003459D1B8